MLNCLHSHILWYAMRSLCFQAALKSQPTLNPTQETAFFSSSRKANKNTHVQPLLSLCAKNSRRDTHVIENKSRKGVEATKHSSWRETEGTTMDRDKRNTKVKSIFYLVVLFIKITSPLRTSHSLLLLPFYPLLTPIPCKHSVGWATLTVSTGIKKSQ